MSKAIIISIFPEWVEKILNDKKTIEIRKTMPKCELPIDVYIYCTKSNYFHLDWAYGKKNKREYFCWDKKAHHYPFDKDDIESQSQKVVAKFTLNKVDEIACEMLDNGVGREPIFYTEDFDDLQKVSCLTQQELRNYLDNQDLGVIVGYAWNIDSLQIFDEPKELKEFKLNKAPQSWCYVEVEE